MKPLTQNLKKMISSLKLKKNREENRLFIVEGYKLCSELLNSIYTPEFLVLRSGAGEKLLELGEKFLKRDIPVYIARKQQFDGLTATKSPQGILAVAGIVDTAEKIEGPFLALDGVSDPGNLGTIIRTADWFGFRNIMLGENSADKFNPKTVRSTMGSLFRCRISYHKNLASHIGDYYKEYEIYGAALDGELSLENCRPQSDRFGIVLGNEANGITPPVMKILDKKFLIPGFGGAESLNVAVSAGISLYHFSGFLNFPPSLMPG